MTICKRRGGADPHKCFSMISKTVAGVLLCIALAGLPAVGGPILDPAHIQEATLDNGLRVIVKQERYWPVAALVLVVRTGSLHESSENAGGAHMIEHLLFEGPANEEALGPWIEDMGGYVNAQTWRDFTQLTIAVASEFIPEVLPRVATGVFAAQFTDEQIARQRQIIGREMADRYTSVDAMVDRLIWDMAFTQHPYRRPIPGTAETVAALTKAEIEDFYNRFYVPSNAALLVVGDVEVDEFMQLAAASFGGYSSGAAPVPEFSVEPPQTEIRKKVKLLGYGVTILQFAWHAAGIGDKAEVCALDLAYTILGAGGGGWLDKHLVRDKQIAINSGVQFLTQREPGLFIITVVCEPDKELPVRETILEEIERLSTQPVSQQTLQQAKRLLYADYAFANDAYTDQVDTLAFYEAIDSYEFATEYIQRIGQVTAADIQAVARKYLGQDNYSLMIIRPQPSEQGTQEVWRR